jgi:hypothetical protein
MRNHDVFIKTATKPTSAINCGSSRRDTGLIFKKIPLRLASGKIVHFWEFKLD